MERHLYTSSPKRLPHMAGLRRSTSWRSWSRRAATLMSETMTGKASGWFWTRHFLKPVQNWRKKLRCSWKSWRTKMPRKSHQIWRSGQSNLWSLPWSNPGWRRPSYSTSLEASGTPGNLIPCAPAWKWKKTMSWSIGFLARSLIQALPTPIRDLLVHTLP